MTAVRVLRYGPSAADAGARGLSRLSAADAVLARCVMLQAAGGEGAGGSEVTAGEAVEAVPQRRSLRPYLFGLTITTILALLFGVPWWTLVVSGARWPGGAVVVGTAAFAGALLAFPLLMVAGHGRRHLDWAARTGDTLLGVVWVLFAWALLGNVLRLVLAVAGVADPTRSRA